ncbi:hypothetical protein EVAR_64283_1 [Eumeta japonica]|uniref:RING-type domain-containing protein n=1 Tax=Eumeta variegata TaxID=151549 RepID=A0A4C1ZU35_EUMVA|nr:hypothetical protein EVAR_64283_1 [Eumeta japonica]
MQTSPCGHRVVCRRCFVKTIQMAVSQRLLPLRCVICRAKILRLRQAPRLVTSKSWQVSSSNGRSWGVPGSASSYSVGARSVPASASLYSVTSGESSLSGVSSVSSNSGGSASTGTGSCTTKLCGGARCGGACLGAIPRVVVPPRARQPASHSLRRSQHHSMKARLQDYQQIHSYTGGPPAEPSGRLPPIREFQREFREGRRDSTAASTSTRIRCAQKIVTQLETSPQKKPTQNFFRTLKPSNKDNPPRSRDHSKESERTKEDPKTKTKKDDKKKKDDENKQYDEKSKKEESNDNKKNEIAEKKKEEKMRLKAEKEAKKEAKLQAKEEERQAKLLAKEEEKQAKLLAKEEKKKAKKEAKLAAQAEKEKNKQSS